jgi:hypothetical protein
MTVFAYHTDHTGLYDEPSKGPHSWRLRGWARTDANGRFDFDTIRPAPYPGRNVAAHVHLSIEGPGVPRRWATGVLFSDDALVTAAEREASARAGVFGEVRTVRTRDGVQEIDVQLRGRRRCCSRSAARASSRWRGPRAILRPWRRRSAAGRWWLIWPMRRRRGPGRGPGFPPICWSIAPG